MINSHSFVIENKIVENKRLVDAVFSSYKQAEYKLDKFVQLGLSPTEWEIVEVCGCCHNHLDDCLLAR